MPIPIKNSTVTNHRLMKSSNDNTCALKRAHIHQKSKEDSIVEKFI